MPGDMLNTAKDWFKARKTMVQRTFSDSEGQYAFSIRIDDQPFIVTAKKYLHDGQASFMARKVVERASDADAYILLFIGDGRRLVFDPDTVMADGDRGPPEDTVRQRRGEEWIDVDAGLSVSLEAWHDRRETPPTVDESSHTFIDDYE